METIRKSSLAAVCAFVLIVLSTSLWSQTITVTFPNGGEQWTAGSTQTIRWTINGTISGTAPLRIRYTVNGTNYNSIQTVPNTSTSLTWLVPNQPSTLCKIRVEHYNTARQPTDDSNGSFTILANDNPPPIGQPDSLILISPNGNERWQRGSQQQITWDKFGAIQNIKLEYSLDFGSTWKLILASTANDGIHNWTVADTTWPMTLIRVSDAIDGFPRDQSNSTFVIIRKSRTGNIKLIWNKNIETDLAGYRLWFSSVSGNFHDFIIILNDTSSADTALYELKNLQPNIYFFALTAFDINGNESGLSNEVSAIIEDYPPDIEIPMRPLNLIPQVKYPQ
jgi:hypothetical protein